MSSLSPAARAAVFIGYAGLVAVNAIYGSGAFGVKTNAELSGAYPSPVTPAGFTFAIWGPIFALQAGGTLLMSLGKAPALGAAAAVPWLCAWTCECLWQFCFAQVPLTGDDKAAGTAAERLAVLIPCLFFLAAAQASMLWASSRIAAAKPKGDLAEALLIALPTGVNAAWLAAATGIGLSLVLKIASPKLGGPAGGATLLGLVLAAATAVAPTLLRRSKALGVGYAAATCWACFGMQHGDSCAVVKQVAAVGGGVVAVATALTLAFGSASVPAPDDPDAKPLSGDKTFL